MSEIQPMPSEEFQHPSITREEFKALLLKSGDFELITECIVDMAYGNLKLVHICNYPEAELLETLIGIRGQDGKSMQFFPIRMLMADYKNAQAK